MARDVSPEICRALGENLNCDIVYGSDNTTVVSFGNITERGFQGDPDIAGIGVLGAFIIITVFSVLLSIGNTAWWISKNVLRWKGRITHQQKADKRWQISVSGFFETLVITCSDQQVFTGGAYAITLRYATACTISAYHYNIVTNMLLFTCATHLMSVTIAKHYWQHPYVAALRIAITTLVYIITGIILSNQNSNSNDFPTRVPSQEDVFNPMLLPAACFQSAGSGLTSDIQNVFHSDSAQGFFTKQIPGFTEYLVMAMFYILAVIISIGRFIRRGTDHDGKRNRFVKMLKRNLGLLFRAKRFFYLLFAVYLIAGIAIACWTVQGSFRYIYDLRIWVGQSKWIKQDGNGENSENDPATFGQLVPLLLMALTVFSFLHLLAEKLSVKKARAKMIDELEDRQERLHSSSGEPQAGAGYFDGTEKSTGVGFAVTEVNNITPGTTTSGSMNGTTHSTYGQPMPQPPHLQSRSQTWASNMTTGTTATQASQHSYGQSQVVGGQHQQQHQQQQQQQQQQQVDIITPVPSTQAPAQPQEYWAGTGEGGYTVFYTTAPSSNVDNITTVPSTQMQPQTAPAPSVGYNVSTTTPPANVGSPPPKQYQ